MKRIFPLLLPLALLGSLAACGDKAPEQQAAAPAPQAALPAAPPIPPAPSPAAADNAPPAVMASAPAVAVPPPRAARVAPPTVIAPAPGPKPLSAAAAHAPAPPDAHAGLTNFQGVIAKIPATWVRQQPANSMRLAQFAVPPAGGAEPGEVVVFHFPAGTGGSQAENIGRWTAQFATADGKPVQPTVRPQEIGKFAVTLVELNGTYSRGVGMGEGANAKANQTLLAAIVITPDKRNVTFHLYGPQATVNAQKAAFEEMIKSLRSPG